MNLVNSCILATAIHSCSGWCIFLFQDRSLLILLKPKPGGIYMLPSPLSTHQHTSIHIYYTHTPAHTHTHPYTHNQTSHKPPNQLPNQLPNHAPQSNLQTPHRPHPHEHPLPTPKTHPPPPPPPQTTPHHQLVRRPRTPLHLRRADAGRAGTRVCILPAAVCVGRCARGVAELAGAGVSGCGGTEGGVC